MVKITLTEETYAPQAEAGAGRYYCRVLPEWNQEHTLVDVVEEVVEHEPTEEDRKDIVARWTAKQKQHKINDIIKYDNIVYNVTDVLKRDSHILVVATKWRQ